MLRLTRNDQIDSAPVFANPGLSITHFNKIIQLMDGYDPQLATMIHCLLSRVTLEALYFNEY
jgi:hypothetical protein